jgi:hypothetical protein
MILVVRLAQLTDIKTWTLYFQQFQMKTLESHNKGGIIQFGSN